MPLQPGDKQSDRSQSEPAQRYAVPPMERDRAAGDPARMRRLLKLTITVLAELAALGDFGGDYDRFY